MAHAHVEISQRDITIGAIRPDERDVALELLVRAMHTNPINDAVAGNDPERSARAMRLQFGAGFQHLGWERHMIVARDGDGAILGVCGMMPPGECQPTGMQRVRLLPSVLRLDPRTILRTLKWLGAWSRRDAATPHWHLGPVAVEPNLQGQGIGTDLMRAFCDHVDSHGDAAWLETDKVMNVRFYERFGFEVAHQEDVLGVRCWYMLRPAKAEVAA